MPRIDLDTPLLLLLWQVVRANAAPLLSTSIMLTGATLAPDLIPDPDGIAPPGTFEMATGVVLLLAWALAETSIAFAVYPTLLTGGVLRGYEALRRAAFPRMVLFIGMQFLLLTVTLAFVALLLVAMLWMGAGDPQSVFNARGTPLLTVPSLLALLALGLALPDIVLTGRLSLGRVLRWNWQWRWTLAIGLAVGAGPAWWASEAVSAWAETQAPVAWAGIVTVWFVVLTYLSVVLHMLGTILAAIALTRVYREVLPPEVLLEAGRVSEVFD